MATCNICRATYEYTGKLIKDPTTHEWTLDPPCPPCWRCDSDNSYWEVQRRLPRLERFIDFFGNVWGVMALLVVILPVIPLVFIIFQSMYFVGGLAWSGYPGFDLSSHKADILGQWLAWFLSFIAVLFLYALRFQLWNYSWIRNVRWKKTPPLNMSAVTLFIIGVFLLLLYLTLVMFWHAPASAPVPVPGASFDFAGIFQKIVMPAIYSLIFVSFSVASMFMAAVIYTARINDYVGQPIYMNTKLLGQVVQKGVAESLEIGVDLTKVANIERTAEGGIRMILSRLKSPRSSFPRARKGRR